MWVEWSRLFSTLLFSVIFCNCFATFLLCSASLVFFHSLLHSCHLTLTHSASSLLIFHQFKVVAGIMPQWLYIIFTVLIIAFFCRNFWQHLFTDFGDFINLVNWRQQSADLSCRQQTWSVCSPLCSHSAILCFMLCPSAHFVLLALIVALHFSDFSPLHSISCSAHMLLLHIRVTFTDGKMVHIPSFS